MLRTHCHSPSVPKCEWEGDPAPASTTSTTLGPCGCPYMPQVGSVWGAAPSSHSDRCWQALPWLGSAALCLLQGETSTSAEAAPRGRSCAACEVPSTHGTREA